VAIVKRSGRDEGVSGATASGPAASSAGLANLVPRWAVPVVLVPAVAALIGGDAAGRPWLAAAVIVVQAVLIVAWLVLLDASFDAAALVFAAVAVADVVLLRKDTVTGGSVVGVIGLSVVAVLLHQLALRHRKAVTTSVATNLSAIVLATALALLLPLRALGEGRGVIYASVVGAAAAVGVARLVGGRSEVLDLVGRLVGLAVAGGAASAIAAPSGGLTVGDGLAAGLTAAFAALLADRALRRVTPPKSGERARGTYLWALAAVSALVPLALASPVAYLAGRIISPGIG
jgi:hypothetical protein